MSLTENAKKYHERMFPGYESVAIKKDPEFIERFGFSQHECGK